MSQGSGRLVACRALPPTPGCALRASTSHGLRAGQGFASIGEARASARCRAGTGLRRVQVGRRSTGAGCGRGRRRCGDRVARDRAQLVASRHPASRPAASLRPILAITGPRELARATKRHRDLEIDDEVYRRARVIAEGELSGGRSLSRDELFAAWQLAGIATAAQRGYHLIWRLALEAVVCAGPVEGRGQRFVLCDEWIPAAASDPARDETLAALLTAYLDGHGPATVRDFAWWSGLTLGDARTAHAAAGDAVVAFDDERLVIAGAETTTPGRSVRLALAPFDEYFLGYADRRRCAIPVRPARRPRLERRLPADPRRERPGRGRVEGEAGRRRGIRRARPVRTADRRRRVRERAPRSGRDSGASRSTRPPSSRLSGTPAMGGPGARDRPSNTLAHGTDGPGHAGPSVLDGAVITAAARPAARG